MNETDNENEGQDATREHGVQPLDALLTQHGVSNHELMAVRPDLFLTHKQIAKARRGRQITRRMQLKVLEAVNSRMAPMLEKELKVGELFNYK